MDVEDGLVNGPRARSGKVLVLGQDNRSFLAVVRSLGRRGLEVHIAWHAPDSIARRSRYVAREHVLPGVHDGPRVWLAPFVALLERESFDLVIPTNDPSVIGLHRERAALARFDNICLPDAAAIDVTFDKLATWELARRLSIPVPRQVVVRDIAMASRVEDELGLPIVLKPRQSFAFDRLKWEHKVLTAFESDAVTAHLRTLLATDEVLAQAHFAGRGVGVELLTEHGEVLLAFQHERVHEPPLGGGSSYRRSVPLTPELLLAAQRVLRELDYTGVAMVEFKRHPATGDWVLIEVNARFWGSLPLAIACGVDFPYALYQLWMRGPRARPRAYRHGVHSRNWWLDVAWMLQNLKSDRRDPRLCTRSLPAVALESSNLLRMRERSDEFVWDDPMPGLVEVDRLLAELRTVAFRKLKALPLAFVPVRRFHAARIRRRLSLSRRLLFVCRGNLCRSPFAEHHARRFAPASFEIESAGTHAEESRPCPSEAIAAARQLGADLSHHRSRAVDAACIDRAELIFVFDESDRGSVCDRFPEAAHKVRRLGLLDPRAPVLIRDPYGYEFRDYVAAYRAIATALTSIATVREG